jgi:hypothetical protein
MKAIPAISRGRLYGSETSRLPHFLDSRLTDDSDVSALSTNRPLPPGGFVVLISVRG